MKLKFLYTSLFILNLFSISVLNSQTIFTTSFYSQALEENKNVSVFLPSGYDTDTSSYPVIYYLHGWYGSESSAQQVMALADTYINSGKIEPVIIVCPNNRSNPFLGSFYLNSELNGNYEDYMTQDLITWVESNYRAKSGKKYRSLMGQSMGGYGSFHLAINHKDLYRAIAAHGSAINFDLVIDDITEEIKNENGSGPNYFYDFSTTGLFTKMIFAMAGAFTPNSNTDQDYINPAVVDFPYDEQGNVIGSTYQEFVECDPVSKIGTLLPSDSVAILFGAGRNDELHLFQSNYSFRDTLDSYGLEYEYVDHYGTHNMPTLFRERGLIFLDSIMSVSAQENSNPVTLPFTEDWEANDGEKYTNGQMYIDNGFSWEFETSLQGEGRVRWGNKAHQPNTGSGALSMDRNPSKAGKHAVNSATLTLDLSNYSESSSLALSFWWADHGDEEHSNDKVWIRGNENDPWIIIYDLNPVASTNNSYQQVTQLDIDYALELASQSITSTFQLRFGQEDDYNTNWDGMSFDDIVIEELAGLLEPVTLPFIEDWECENGERYTNDEIYCTGEATWSFETNQENEGRVRWGTNTHQPNTGNGALTMDRNPSSSGNYAINYTTLTLDLSNYTESSNLSMSFWWAEHGDEEHTNDKVWIRGSEEDTWVMIYDLDPKGITDDTYQLVDKLDIDATLASASQTVSNTFQLRFGQEDDCNSDWDGISIDDIIIEDLVELDPVTLPFTEDWETTGSEKYINGIFYASNDFKWSFETNKQTEGRIRWGNQTHQPNTGTGAITMDRNPSKAGKYAINSAILTLDLSNYTESNLALSFWWADHGDEDHSNDKVWVRGSEDDTWVIIYDINPTNALNNSYQFVAELDIDSTLAIASQSITNTFQVRFGQEDDYNTDWDGLSFDDIKIQEVSESKSSISVSSPETDLITSKDDIQIYTYSNNLFIRSTNNAVNEQKEVLVYDFMGRLTEKFTIAPAPLVKIPLENCNCNRIIKVISNNSMYRKKVFLK